MSSLSRQFNDYLRRIAAQFGLNDLALDETGFCALELTDLHLQINIELIRDEIFCLHADLGEYYQREESKLFAMLLMANLYGRETDGATLAIDQTRRQIVLCTTRRTQEIRDFPQFQGMLEVFIDTAARWAERIDQF
jgi:hypothetical protein